MREVHLNFVYEIDDDDLSDDDAARLAGDMMFDYVSSEVFDHEHPNVEIIHIQETVDTPVNIVKAALTDVALTRLLEYHTLMTEREVSAPDYWGGVPDAMNILRDIFRGYVVARDGITEFPNADAWTEVGMEADYIVLEALERISNE